MKCSESPTCSKYIQNVHIAVTHVDMLFVVTTELSVEFSSEMSSPSGINFAAMPVGCVHGIGKTSASIVVGLWSCLLGSQRAAVANCCAKKQWIYA